MRESGVYLAPPSFEVGVMSTTRSEVDIAATFDVAWPRCRPEHFARLRRRIRKRAQFDLGFWASVREVGSDV